MEQKVLRTVAVNAIALVAQVAGAVERADVVRTGGIHVAVVSVLITLIDV